MKTFTVTIRLGVDIDTDEHLQTVDAIAAEIRSWLTDLDADVQEVTITEVKV
jgi:hypothetical protein